MITVGIDEVGRGCWAGPLVAAGVILGVPVAGLKDSKILSKKQRLLLAKVISEEAIATGIGWVAAAVVDKVGITTAVKMAMADALDQITVPYDEVIIDGNINYLAEIASARAVVKADMMEASVSAASIIAKVARDEYMEKQALEFPLYGFERHVGYGTAQHLAALKSHGICMLHRTSFKPVRAFL